MPKIRSVDPAELPDRLTEPERTAQPRARRQNGPTNGVDAAGGGALASLGWPALHLASRQLSNATTAATYTSYDVPAMLNPTAHMIAP